MKLPKQTIHLKMDKIYKDFNGVLVLEDVNMEAFGGEIIAILGQNGAGKSTLMKILAGVYPQGDYSGKIIINGEEKRFSNVNDAEKSGVVMIPQEIEVFPNLSVAENLFFNRLREKLIVDWNVLYAEAELALKEFGLDKIDPRTPMFELTRAQHQLILITKALLQSECGASIDVLILDEPTASLTDAETYILFEHLNRIKKSGVACLYISHRLEEVFRISDRFFVMRDGCAVGHYKCGETTMEDIITFMVGGRLQKMIKSKDVKFGKKLLEVKGLVVCDPIEPSKKLVNSIDLNLHEGEILGVFGLVGSGKTETAMGIFGAWDGPVKGEFKISGKVVDLHTPLRSINNGIGFLPEDRRNAIMEVRSIKENIMLIILKHFANKIGLLNGQMELKAALNLQEALQLKARSLEDTPLTLSGGNKQKALVARLLGAKSRIMIIDEPTVGVDINTRQDLYHILRKLAEKEKCGILLFSSDVEEVIQISDQVIVFRGGKVAAFFDQANIISGKVTQDVLLAAAAS